MRVTWMRSIRILCFALTTAMLAAMWATVEGVDVDWIGYVGGSWSLDNNLFGKFLMLVLALLALLVGLRWMPAICITAAYAFWWPSVIYLAEVAPIPALIAVVLLPISSFAWIFVWTEGPLRLSSVGRVLTFVALFMGFTASMSLSAGAFMDKRWLAGGLLGVAGFYCGIGVATVFFLLFGRLAERDSGGAALVGAGCLTLVLFPFWPVLLVRQLGTRAGELSADHAAMIERASGAAGLTGQRLEAARHALAGTLETGESVLSVVPTRQGPDIWLTDTRAIFINGRRVTAERPLTDIVARAHLEKGGREKSHWLHIRFADGTHHNAYFGRDHSETFAGVTTNAAAVRQVTSAIAAVDAATSRRTELAPRESRPFPPPQI